MKKKETQRKKVKKWLKAGKRITPLEALRWFGCMRLSAVIHSLRHEDDMYIVTKIVKVKTRYGSSHVAQYREFK